MANNLEFTEELQVTLGAPEYETIIMHPNEGQKMGIYEQTEEFFLYTEREDFINATENGFEVTLNHENDFDLGQIQVKNKLNKELGDPDTVKVYRKNSNLFISPQS